MNKSAPVPPLDLAFCLYKYFPHGGMQRDFLAIANYCRDAGHRVRAYVDEWRGSAAEFEVICAADSGIYGRGLLRKQRFKRWLAAQLQSRPADRVIGFNQLPGLDLYYNADGCYAEQLSHKHSFWRLINPRYRWLLRYEQYLADSKCRILTLSEAANKAFRHHYRIATEHLHLLPPFVHRDFIDALSTLPPRNILRKQLGIADDTVLLLLVGSNLQLKGLDRSLQALAAQPPNCKFKLLAVGAHRRTSREIRKLAEKLRADGKLTVLPPCDIEHIAKLMKAADVYLHPAYLENTGLTLIEAMYSGLPIICSAVCGHAPLIQQAGCGQVLTEPFAQQELNRTLTELINAPELRENHSRSAREFARRLVPEQFLGQVLQQITGAAQL